MKSQSFVFKNSDGKWVSGFSSRQAAIEAAISTGLSQFETASVSTESPAYFVRFLAKVALQKMIDGMRDGEVSGHVVDSEVAQEILVKVAAADISDAFESDVEGPGQVAWDKIVDLMNRLQDATEAWFVHNELADVKTGFVDYGSTELHIKGMNLNIPLL
ncbi:hypothetical protein QZM99_13995 [Burkholderia gladioli]|uniref:hypothetical protein n=1 Tax=Burkholderia gladioli TaxID=28095 RepID=UPI00264B42D6|nr:hypothetical protein [Burkholderia gladioli]MDN7919196.1 hypothetical protein [Burkholderia gladioli]